MTNKQHPITPPPELAQTLWNEMRNAHTEDILASYAWDRAIAKAYRAGANKELELTLKIMRTLQIRGVDYIHRVRRPGLSSKTPSLKERLTTAIVNGDERLAIQLLDEALPNE